MGSWISVILPSTQPDSIIIAEKVVEAVEKVAEVVEVVAKVENDQAVEQGAEIVAAVATGVDEALHEFNHK